MFPDYKDRERESFLDKLAQGSGCGSNAKPTKRHSKCQRHRHHFLGGKRRRRTPTRTRTPRNEPKWGHTAHCVCTTMLGPLHPAFTCLRCYTIYIWSRDTRFYITAGMKTLKEAAAKMCSCNTRRNGSLAL